MKKYFYLLSLMLLVACSNNSTTYVTEGYIGNKNHSKDDAGFFGPIKDVTTITEFIDMGSKETDYYCFNEQGDYTTFTRAIGQIQANVTYDERGNKIKETFSKTPSGTVIETAKFKYNEYGQMIQSDRVSTLFLKKRTVDNYVYQDTLVTKKYSSENSYVSFKYDEKGRMVERLVFVDKPLQTILYTYDDQGNLLQTYDDLNKRYKIHYYQGHQLDYIIVEDDNHKVVDRITFTYELKNGSKTITETGYKEKIVKIYDAYGNMIKKEEYENGVLTYRYSAEINYN